MSRKSKLLVKIWHWGCHCSQFNPPRSSCRRDSEVFCATQLQERNCTMQQHRTVYHQWWGRIGELLNFASNWKTAVIKMCTSPELYAWRGGTCTLNYNASVKNRVFLPKTLTSVTTGCPKNHQGIQVNWWIVRTAQGRIVSTQFLKQ